MNLKGKRAITYLRVSLADLNENNQRVPIQKFCELHGIILVREFSDKASGRTDDRPGLKRALTALNDPEVDLLISFSVDRLARSLPHIIRIVEEIRSKKKGLWLIRESLDLTGSNPQSELFLGLFSSIASWEASLISERTKVALAVARMSGRRLGRPTKRNSEVENRILDLYDQGVPIREIARRTPELARSTIQNVIRAKRVGKKS